MGLQDVRHLLGGVALGDAAQIHGAARIQRDDAAVHVDVLAAHQRQQGIDLLLGGDMGRVGGDAPQGYQRSYGHIEGTAGLIGQGQRPFQKLPRLLLHRHGLTGVEAADIAGGNGKSKEDWQMKGYDTSNGYMGYVEGKYILFASEQEYFEFMED